MYNKLNKYSKAIEYAYKGLKIAKEIGALDDEKESYQYLSYSYDSLGNYKKAFEYHKLYSTTKDSLFNAEKNKQITEMETRYQTEKKQQEIEKQNLLLEKKDVEIKKQAIQRNSFIIGAGLLLVLAFVIYGRYRQKKKANELITYKNQELEQANEEICVQRDEIETQRDIVIKQKEHIEEINVQITDSIHYAKYIQGAVLPDSDYLREILGEHFILFKPRDIVSGDFYWAAKIKQWLIFIVADCTGHGVPGAFMSMLGISFLNEIISKDEVTQANHVLNYLRVHVIESLKQKGILGEQQDGMDIALCALNTDTLELQYAGANNPLYIIRKNQTNLDEIKGDKMPIGIHQNMQPFTNHITKLHKGDTLYLMSDGYKDQIGGEKEKKFLSKRLKELILSITNESMEQQCKILDNTIEDWITGHKEKYEQTDDITVLGIKI
ncbi:MAG: SpoIIE family protein phosphatase [Bacteroidia bacterium]|nr:SpoIIE family protein phosphatase [Bacteroidia bacterium]